MKLHSLITPDRSSDSTNTGTISGALDLVPGCLNAVPDIEISGLTADSRQVVSGYLFAAIPGTLADGAKFAEAAAAAGASVILASADATLPPLNVPVLRSTNVRRDLALLAARFYGPQPKHIIAITGTSGKTSVADFTRQIFTTLGRQAASLGTIGLVKPDGGVYGSLTTPDPVSLAKTLAELAAEGVTHLALEASSHGLDQARLDGARLTIGAFTNLGRDHLDYHKDVEEYFAAKMRLFNELLDSTRGVGVVNLDGARADDVAGVIKARGLQLMSVGARGETLRLVEAKPEGFAQAVTIEFVPGIARDRAASANTTGEPVRETVRVKLIGDYQASNAVLAAGLAIAAGEEPRSVIAALASLRGVSGRLELVGEARGGLAVVDYAHKPDALIAALNALRPFVSGKLICVFGCGGDRDKGKRALMGEIAAKLADVVIVTDDNPRSEDPASIRAQIMAAAPGAREIGERAQAIREGAALLGKGDVLLVAGKGHETGQIVGDKVLPFSDHDAIADALGQS